MFSAENNGYPFSYHLPPPFSIPESDNNIFNNIQQPNHHSLNMLHDSYNYIPFLLNPPVPRSYPINNNIFPPNSTTNSSLEPSITQESNLINCPFFSSGSSSSKKPPGKKDRHTKISTAQGLRDRRVRLSINIAKEFFNLQDLLGFDKASKTLGWLLSKSKSAIDELVSSSNSKSSPSSTSHGEVVAPDVNGDEKKQEASAKKRRERRSGEGGNGDDIAREMRRVKARERARERTKQKKITTMVKDFQSGLSYHQRAQKNLMIQPSSSEVATQNNGSCYGICNQTQQGMVSVGDKSESRSSGSCLNFTCDQISYSRLDDQEIYINNHYYNNDYLMKLALESNDGFIRPPGFSALNIINLSTEIHINGKPWENRGNDQILQ